MKPQRLFQKYIIILLYLTINRSILYGNEIDTLRINEHYTFDTNILRQKNKSDSVIFMGGKDINGLMWWLNWSEIDNKFEHSILVKTTDKILKVNSLQIFSDSISLDLNHYPISLVKEIELIKKERFTRGAQFYNYTLSSFWTIPVAFLIEAVIWKFTPEYNWEAPLLISSGIVVGCEAYGQISYKPYALKYDYKISF